MLSSGGICVVICIGKCFPLDLTPWQNKKYTVNIKMSAVISM